MSSLVERLERRILMLERENLDVDFECDLLEWVQRLKTDNERLASVEAYHREATRRLECALEAVNQGDNPDLWAELVHERDKLKQDNQRLRNEIRESNRDADAHVGKLLADNERLQTELADIKNSTKAAMDERCDLYERHCTCVPLLRHKIKQLREALHNWVVTPVGSHQTCDCPKCTRLVDIVLEDSDD